MAFLPKTGKHGLPVYPTDKRPSKAEPLILAILEERKWQGLTVGELQQVIEARYGAEFGYSTIGAACMKMTDDKLLARRWEWFTPKGMEGQTTRRHVYYLPQYSNPIAGYW